MDWYENVVKTCMGIKAGEHALLITDAALAEEQERLAEIMHAMGPAEVLRWTLPEEERPLKVAPDHILEAVRTFDAALMFLGTTTVAEQPFRLSLVKAVAESGRIRMASGLNIDQAIMDNELSADYEAIADLTYRVKNKLVNHAQVSITSPLGTDLRLSIEGRKVAVDPGVIRTPGYNNLPAGECYVAPVESSANGVLVIDKSFPGILIENPITLVFHNGRAIDIQGGQEAAALIALIEEGEQKEYGDGCRTIAELGIGTNTEARITGNVMTDEKVLGTIHVALGHNSVAPYNGQNTAPIHLDGVMGEPTLVVDGETLIDGGRYLI